MSYLLRDEWEMDFAESGVEALALLSNTAFDGIVSDMRMPGMDGARLLHEVRQRYPQMVRLILSGHSDREMSGDRRHHISIWPSHAISRRCWRRLLAPALCVSCWRMRTSDASLQPCKRCQVRRHCMLK